MQARFIPLLDHTDPTPAPMTSVGSLVVPGRPGELSQTTNMRGQSKTESRTLPTGGSGRMLKLKVFFGGLWV